MIFNCLKKSERLYRVVFPCKFLDDTLGTERLWCGKEMHGYRVDNIPFYVPNIALGDLIKVEKVNGELWFEDLIRASGNSVIQLRILTNSSQSDVGRIFEKLGCEWEGSDRADLIAISVPSQIDYAIVEEILVEGDRNGKWDYREACLGWK